MTSLCSGREKVRPVRSHVNAKAKKFAQRGKNGLKIAVYGVLGEYFRARAPMGLVLGEFFCVRAEMGLALGGFSREGPDMPCCWRTVPRDRDMETVCRLTMTRRQGSESMS